MKSHALLLSTLALFLATSFLTAGDPVQMDRKQMAGKWKVISQDKDGKKTPDDQFLKTRYIFAEDGKLVVETDGKTVLKASIKIDPTKKPKQADYEYGDAPPKKGAKPALGIYEIDGDKMRTAVANVGGARPTDFTPKGGVVVITYKGDLPPKLFTNAVGMKFIWVYPDSFLMGSNDKEEGHRPDEILHKVKITKGFFMGIDPVTQEQWEAVMGNNPSHFRGEKNLPVEQVSWLDCQEFIKKLKDKDKKPYRLPTEAEWEYACRAGKMTPFSFGDTITTDQANYDGNEIYGKGGKKGVSRGTTTPVGTFPANGFGLHDMHGNVWEWCQDWYGPYPPQPKDAKDMKETADPQGPDKGELRVVRGGARFNSPAFIRSASRQAYLPTYRSSYIGVRICFSE